MCSKVYATRRRHKAAEPAADGEKVTIKYIGWRTEDQAAITKMNELFTAEHPNIEVVYEPIQATEYDIYLQTAPANGTAADVVMTRSYGGGARYSAAAKSWNCVYRTLASAKTRPPVSFRRA